LDKARVDERRVLACGHEFHKACVNKWFDLCQKTCPVCRFSLEVEEVEAKKWEELSEEMVIWFSSFHIAGVFPTIADWRTSAPKDQMPPVGSNSAADVTSLNTRHTPIQKQPEALLCLVGLSRRYFLGDDVYPTFIYDDDWDMDLFSLISAPNPAKVKTRTRICAAHEVLWIENGAKTSIYGFVTVKSAYYSKSRQSHEKSPSMLLERARKNESNAGSESRPPMLNKENYVPWSSCLLRYAKSRPNGKLIHNSIINGPYTDEELTKKELKQIEADDQAIQTILLGLPEDIYAAVDSCETAQEIWLRVQQMMKGSDIRIQEKKAKLFNE
nr:E3 ubiquitin-protein ligase RHA2A [Tanacetum cinerariifolium]